MRSLGSTAGSALLPDGTTTERSVSRAMTQRDIDLRRDPQGEVAADLEAGAKVAPELQLSPGGATPRSVIRTPRGMPDGEANISGMQAAGAALLALAFRHRSVLLS